MLFSCCCVGLYQYSVALRQWMWVSGPAEINFVSPEFDIVFAPHPTSREDAVSWKLPGKDEGSLLLFGGRGPTSSGNQYRFLQVLPHALLFFCLLRSRLLLLSLVSCSCLLPLLSAFLFLLCKLSLEPVIGIESMTRYHSTSESSESLSLSSTAVTWKMLYHAPHLG